MAKKETYTCDVCGVERKEANHWFVGLYRGESDSRGNLPVVERDMKHTADGLEFYCWPTGSGCQNAVHLCGQVCAHKLLDEFLSK